MHLRNSTKIIHGLKYLPQSSCYFRRTREELSMWKTQMSCISFFQAMPEKGHLPIGLVTLVS